AKLGRHQMDIARSGIKGGTLPTKVYSLGGRFTHDGPDQGQTPNMQLAVMEFGKAILLFEVRGLTGRHPDFPDDVSNYWITTLGAIKPGGGRREGYMFYPKAGGEPQKLEVPEPKLAVADAVPAFLEPMRNRTTRGHHCAPEFAH